MHVNYSDRAMTEQQETRAKSYGLCFGKTRILEVGNRELNKLKRFLTTLKPRSIFGMRPALIRLPSRYGPTIYEWSH
jgi:hypothetical protein